MPLITIVSAPKPFTDPHIAMIQRNAIQSWMDLAPDVTTLLVGNEDGLEEVAREFSIHLEQNVANNSYGTPLVSSMVKLAREQSDSALIAIVNTDILLLPDFVETARTCQQQFARFLIVSQRWDMEVRDPLAFSKGWVRETRKTLQESGRRHARGGSDVFVFPRMCYQDIPELAIGRAGWDNWMIYKARREGWAVIDASAAMDIIHQDHDYRHLPDGQPHYRLPETEENIRLGGGNRTIFNLDDATNLVKDQQTSRAGLTWKKLLREVEIFPMIRLRSILLGNVFFAVFHPVKAYRELRKWMRG